jgi:hypothetical protein
MLAGRQPVLKISAGEKDQGLPGLANISEGDLTSDGGNESSKHVCFFRT